MPPKFSNKSLVLGCMSVDITIDDPNDHYHDDNDDDDDDDDDDNDRL